MALATFARRLAPSLLAARQPLAVAATRAVSTMTFAASAEPASDNVERTGWGSTKVADLLRAKGTDSGAWLWVSKDDLVIDAVRKMTKGNVGSLLVFDPTKVSVDATQASEEAVCGIITERDYLTKMVIQGRSSLSTKVAEVMTPGKKLLTAEPEDTVVEVMSAMSDNNVRHMPVVDQGNMVGMVSMRDMVNVMVKEHREEMAHMQDYIAGNTY